MPQFEKYISRAGSAAALPEKVMAKTFQCKTTSPPGVDERLNDLLIPLVERIAVSIDETTEAPYIYSDGSLRLGSP